MVSISTSPLLPTLHSTAAGLDMSSDEHRITRSVYIAVLSKDEKSPLSPESDEEKAKDEKKPDSDKDKAKDSSAEKDKTKDKDKAADKQLIKTKRKMRRDKDKKDESVVVKIDIDGIGQRILSLPIPAKNYLNLLSGKSGILFLSEGPQVVVTEDDQPNVSQTIQKFDLSKRKVDKVHGRRQRLHRVIRWRKDSLSQRRFLGDSFGR